MKSNVKGNHCHPTLLNLAHHDKFSFWAWLTHVWLAWHAAVHRISRIMRPSFVYRLFALYTDRVTNANVQIGFGNAPRRDQLEGPVTRLQWTKRLLTEGTEKSQDSQETAWMGQNIMNGLPCHPSLAFWTWHYRHGLLSEVLWTESCTSRVFKTLSWLALLQLAWLALKGIPWNLLCPQMIARFLESLTLCCNMLIAPCTESAHFVCRSHHDRCTSYCSWYSLYFDI